MRANFLKADRLLTKGFTQNFKKNIIVKEKNVKDQIRKVFSQKKHPRKNLHNTWVLRIIWFFWKSYLGYKNWIFPWKTIWTYICYWGWGTFSWGLFFPMSFFLKLSKKYTRKKPWKNSEESQKKYQPTGTLEKLCKTQTVADLHLNWQSCHVIQYSKFCHNKHGKRFEVIKKQV